MAGSRANSLSYRTPLILPATYFSLSDNNLFYLRNKDFAWKTKIAARYIEKKLGAKWLQYDLLKSSSASFRNDGIVVAYSRETLKKRQLSQRDMGILLLLLFLYCAYQSMGWKQGLDGRCLPPSTPTPRVKIYACIVPHIIQIS